MAKLEVEKPGPHIDQMLRQTRAHHVQLSTLADLKASVLLTTAAIIVPLTLRFVDDPDLRVPAYIMIGFALATVLLAAYGTMPKIGGKRPSPSGGRLDLLFFADFVQLDFDEYVSRMQEVMQDPSRTYEIQLRELYQMGTYLCHAKYRYIRLAYRAFILGVVTSGLAWGVQRVLHLVGA